MPMLIVDDKLSPKPPNPPRKIPWGTKVLMTENAFQEMMDYTTKKDRPKGRFLKRLTQFANSGFKHWIGDHKPVRLEWDDVYRVGDFYTKFRLYGFFTSKEQTEFVVLDAFENKKSGDGALKPHEIERINNNVVEPKKSGTWQRAEKGEQR